MPFESRKKIGEKLVFGAIKMRAAGNVEQEAVGRIDREQRRVALAPIGDGVEQAPVVRRMLGDDGEIGIARARFGERALRRGNTIG